MPVAARFTIAQISDAVRRYRIGVTEDPWRAIERPSLRASWAMAFKSRSSSPVQHVGDRMGLTLYASPYKFFRRTDLGVADVAPGIFGYADLEASHGV